MRLSWPGLSAAALVLAVTFECAGGEWVEIRSVGPFELRSEFSLGDQTARRLLLEMGRLQADVDEMLNIQTGSDPIEVNLFRTKSSYQAYVRQRIPEGASRPALFVKGSDKGRVYLYRRWGYEQDLRHECTHALLHNAFPYVPLWLDEGLAEYFEVSPEKRPSGHTHLGETKRRILFGWRPDLRRLESLSGLSEMGAAEYRESWAWAHFLLHGPQEVRQLLSDYLHDIASGELAGPFSDRLYARFPQADQHLVTHLRQWR
jgi:hypothetical protein